MSEDPIGLQGGINQYAYALNDPVNLSDPTGLIPCTRYWIVMGGFVNMATLVISGGCDADDPNAGRNSELGERGRGSSIFGAGMVLGGSNTYHDDGSGPAGVPENSQGTPAEPSAAQRALSAVWQCKYDAIGILTGAVGGGAARKLANAATDARRHGQQLYQLGHSVTGPLPHRGLVQDGLKAMRQANLYDAAATTFEMTQVGGFMVGAWDFGNCLWDEY